MGREDLIGAVAAVLASHDTTADYSSYCICRQKLWGTEDSVTMRRHRAEKIIDHLETLAVLKEVIVT